MISVKVKPSNPDRPLNADQPPAKKLKAGDQSEQDLPVDLESPCTGQMQAAAPPPEAAPKASLPSLLGMPSVEVAAIAHGVETSQLVEGLSWDDG